jgi:hypothetical protein
MPIDRDHRFSIREHYGLTGWLVLVLIAVVAIVLFGAAIAI